MISEKDLKFIKVLLKDATSPMGMVELLEQHMKGTHSSGGYATVFIPKDKDYVIKAIRSGDNDSYSAYARYCKRYADCFPNLPKVYSIFKNYHLEFFVIEKLKHNARLSASFTKKYIERHHGSVVVSKFNPLYPVLRKIQKIQRESMCGVQTDYGGDNIMFRRDGTAVITDPLAD